MRVLEGIKKVTNVGESISCPTFKNAVNSYFFGGRFPTICYKYFSHFIGRLFVVESINTTYSNISPKVFVGSVFVDPSLPHAYPYNTKSQKGQYPSRAILSEVFSIKSTFPLSRFLFLEFRRVLLGACSYRECRHQTCHHLSSSWCYLVFSLRVFLSFGNPLKFCSDMKRGKEKRLSGKQLVFSGVECSPKSEGLGFAQTMSQMTPNKHCICLVDENRTAVPQGMVQSGCPSEIRGRLNAIAHRSKGTLHDTTRAGATSFPNVFIGSEGILSGESICGEPGSLAVREYRAGGIGPMERPGPGAPGLISKESSSASFESRRHSVGRDRRRSGIVPHPTRRSTPLP